METFLLVEYDPSPRTVALVKDIAQNIGNVSNKINLFVSKVANNDPKLTRSNVQRLPCLHFNGQNIYNVDDIRFVIKNGRSPEPGVTSYTENLLKKVMDDLDARGEGNGKQPTQIDEVANDELIEAEKDRKRREYDKRLKARPNITNIDDSRPTQSVKQPAKQSAGSIGSKVGEISNYDRIANALMAGGE